MSEHDEMKTEEIREGYGQDEFGQPNDVYLEEFDRWLDRHDKAVRVRSYSSALKATARYIDNALRKDELPSEFLRDIAERIEREGIRDE